MADTQNNTESKPKTPAQPAPKAPTPQPVPSRPTPQPQATQSPLLRSAQAQAQAQPRPQPNRIGTAQPAPAKNPVKNAQQNLQSQQAAVRQSPLYAKALQDKMDSLKAKRETLNNFPLERKALDNEIQQLNNILQPKQEQPRQEPQPRPAPEQPKPQPTPAPTPAPEQVQPEDGDSTRATDESLLAQSGYKDRYFISFKNKDFKNIFSNFTQTVLNANKFDDMACNLMLASVLFPLDVIDKYMDHLDRKKANKANALANARGNWDNQQLKKKNMTTLDVYKTALKTAQKSLEMVPDQMKLRDPGLFTALPKDKDGKFAYDQFSKDQVKKFKKFSKPFTDKAAGEALCETFNRQLSPKEIKTYIGAMERCLFTEKKDRHPQQGKAKSNAVLNILLGKRGKGG